MQFKKQTKKRNNKICQCECKNYRNCKKDYSCNPSTFFCENGKYLNSIANTSATECDETVFVADIVSTKKKNTIATNVTSTSSINSHSKKSKRFLYFAYSFISNHITTDNYYYLLSL